MKSQFIQRDASAPRRRRLLKLAALPLMSSVGLGAARAQAQARAWPEAQPIRFVVGYPAGQSTDVIARRFAAVMSAELGQTIWVENRPGANGILGTRIAMRSAPDGYTVLFGGMAQLAINPGLYKNLGYDPLSDFAPVGLVVTAPVYLVAHPSFPANNVQELIAYARARPGAVDYASGGIGIGAHLAMELLQLTAGIKLHHIPYNGSPAALNDVMGGRIGLAMDAGTATMPHVQAGRLKALGSAGATRASAFPDVPTIAEQGLPGFSVSGWNAMMVPAGTPQPVIEALNAAMRKACTDPQLVAALRSAAAVECTPTSPAEFGAFLDKEIKKWGAAIRSANVQVE
ncbi:MAG: Bug family tripartite tricarboxylate transporter substrate binding protein [Bradyrhizobium sp.]|uniref:Bug family tripartite tricarboxylate transporter substrate binding protein n=1 Tax=Bradyrhizobium sp. TaxID=376 RepID=UPI003D0D295D